MRAHPLDVEADLTTEEEAVGTALVPRVEVTASREHWLLNENEERIRPVCGAQMAGRPMGDVCVKYAGHGTSHRGKGRCAIHGGGDQVRSSVYLNLIDLTGGGKSIRDSLEKAEAVGEDLFKLDSEIQLLSGLVSLAVEEQVQATHEKGVRKVREDGSPLPMFTLPFMKRLNTVVNQLIRAKIARERQVNKLVLNPQQLEAFVDRIFTIIEKETPSPVAEKIRNRILNEIISPFEELENAV